MKKRWFGVIVVLAACIGSCSKKHDDPNAQINSEITVIDNYLTTAPYAQVGYANTGLRVAVTSPGDGVPPHTGQKLQYTYVGKLFPAMTIFIGPVDIKDQLLDDVTPDALRGGLSSLFNGGTGTIFSPSAYAYGSTGSSDKTVPPNTSVMYEVTLKTVAKTAAEQAQFDKDTTTLHTYLKDSTGVVKHKSGIWYKIKTPGTGTYPNSYDNVTMHYKGIVLSNGTVFQEGDLTSSNIFGLIDGLKAGLPLINEGSIARFYIPSGLAYGPTGGTGIPANANLIFEVKLNSAQ